MAKIVVVEDEAELAAAIAARLRSDGHSVAVAEDGPGAVRMVASGRPDAVVLDLMLPGFDGLEVCRQIQRDHPVPVIMLTARASETGLRYLGAAEAIGLRRAICAQPAGKDAGAAFNLSRARANEALTHACGPLRPAPATRTGP